MKNHKQKYKAFIKVESSETEWEQQEEEAKKKHEHKIYVYTMNGMKNQCTCFYLVDVGVSTIRTNTRLRICCICSTMYARVFSLPSDKPSPYEKRHPNRYYHAYMYAHDKREIHTCIHSHLYTSMAHLGALLRTYHAQCTHILFIRWLSVLRSIGRKQCVSKKKRKEWEIIYGCLRHTQYH